MGGQKKPKKTLDIINGCSLIVFLGRVPVNLVKCPLHIRINLLNQVLHIGYHYTARKYLPGNRVPKRKKGTVYKLTH